MKLFAWGTVAMGCFCLVMTVVNLIFYLGLTHQLISLFSAIFAGIVGPFAIASGLRLLSMLRRYPR